jgi:hypothetical protein
LGKAATYTVRDLWLHSETTGEGSIQVHVPAHATFLYRITAR